MTLPNSTELKVSQRAQLSTERKETPPKKAEAFKKHLKSEEVEEEPKQSFFALLNEKEKPSQGKEEKSQATPDAPNVTLPYSFMGMSQTSLQSIAHCAAFPPSAVSADVTQLVETMIGTMQHMVDLNYTETTLILDSDKFAHSPFYKTQIIIREYSTAPKAFNIELLGSSTAVDHFNVHLGALTAAFESAHTTFKVNRLEAYYTGSDESGVGRKGKDEKEWKRDEPLDSDPDQRGNR